MDESFEFKFMLLSLIHDVLGSFTIHHSSYTGMKWTLSGSNVGSVVLTVSPLRATRKPGRATY